MMVTCRHFSEFEDLCAALLMTARINAATLTNSSNRAGGYPVFLRSTKIVACGHASERWWLPV